MRFRGIRSSLGIVAACVALLPLNAQTSAGAQAKGKITHVVISFRRIAPSTTSSAVSRG